MIDLIVFSVGNNKYALNIENIQRIIQASELTNIPNSHNLIDGMMSYEENVIKVLNFRALINLDRYADELKVLFAQLKLGHKVWVDALRHSISTGSKFTKTTNPHMCELGKWIDTFTSHDEKVVAVFKELVLYHRQLHLRGGDALEVYQKDKKAAQQIVDIEITDIYEHTMGALDNFVSELDMVANSFQKLIMYEHNSAVFAIKVDNIEDIAHIQESDIMGSEDKQEDHEFLKLEGVLDMDGILINVIKKIDIPN